MMHEKMKNHFGVVFSEEAHSELLKGAEILAKAVSSTIGPSGHSVIIDNPNGPPSITKDGVTVARSINLKDRLQSIGAELLKEIASKTNDTAGDGPQPAYAKVLTPNGWIAIGQLQVGDMICGTDGSFQKVLGIFAKGKKDIYRVCLSDGNTETRFVECSEEHLWTVKTYYGTKRTMTTKQLFDSGLKRPKKSNGGYYFITPSIVEFKDNSYQLPLDPYLLGVLLGDGSLSTKHEVEIAVGPDEEYILSKVTLPEKCKLRTRHYPNKHYIKASIVGNTRKGIPRGEKLSIIKNILSELNLLGTNSHTKYIPKQYLHSTISNRKKLLEGLIDTDGHINKRGLFEFSTVSEQLCLDVVELCRSLGKHVYCTTVARKQNDGSYGTSPIYRVMELKGNKHGLKVSNIEKTNEQTEMLCIKVSNEDQLYITNDYVPTHNTTTATVLGYAILKEGIKQISSGRDAIQLKHGIDKASAVVTDFLKQNCVQTSRIEDIVNVGTISANGDTEIGQLIAAAIEKIGQDGMLTVEPAKSVQTALEFVEGMHLDTGYVSPFFVTNNEKGTASLESDSHVWVLMTSNKISSLSEILEILEKVVRTEKPLLIIGDDIEGDALHTLIVNKLKGNLQVCAIKAPSYGEYRSDILDDLKTIVGGEVIGATSGVSLKNAQLEHLGKCKKVIVSRNACTIIGDPNDEEKRANVKTRIEELRTNLESNSALDALQHSKLRQRLARLSGGIAIIKVGGSTEIEIKEKKDRVDDAVNATVAAVQEGIVPGGGTALFYAATHLQSMLTAGFFSDCAEDVKAGIELMVRVCEEPLRTIVDNTGVTADIVIERLKQNWFEHESFLVDMHILDDTSMHDLIEKLKTHKQKKLDQHLNGGKFNFGYNAASQSYADLIETGIIDPVKVTRYALEHAVSIAGLLLVCNCVVVHNETNDEMERSIQ